jgi:hypothetical protein
VRSEEIHPEDYRRLRTGQEIRVERLALAAQTIDEADRLRLPVPVA